MDTKNSAKGKSTTAKKKQGSIIDCHKIINYLKRKADQERHRETEKEKHSVDYVLFKMHYRVQRYISIYDILNYGVGK